MNRHIAAATLAVAGMWAPARAAHADNTSPSSVEPNVPAAAAACARPPDADAVVRCALAVSPEVRQAIAQMDAAAGRRQTAGVLLPSNPTLGLMGAQRRRPPPEQATVLNWNITLSQELEIGGQRAARIDETDAAVAAQVRRVKVAEQEVAAGALTAYYEALAAQESVRSATQLAATAETLATYADARAKEALAAGVEADVARAEAARIGLVRFEAERRLAGARAALAALLGVDAGRLALPDALPTGAPPALPASSGRALEDQALALRGEIAAAEMERQVLERHLVLVRRERVPNPTISAFFERGEINDSIAGVNLAIPIPLPSPVGRTRAGEIAETLAQIRAAETSAELVRRRVRLEVARALAAFQAQNAAVALFARDLLARAKTDLASLREAITARQLTMREGLQWQRSLIELLQADIDVRLGQALSWVELRRVVGLPFAVPAGGAK
jgi:cobalt-zinc-cadmium efflux system outer membrane protein